MTKREGLVLFGIGLTFAGSLLLFFVYGLASMANGYLWDDPGYWSKVLRDMFDRGGLVAVPAVVGAVAPE